MNLLKRVTKSHSYYPKMHKSNFKISIFTLISSLSTHSKSLICLPYGAETTTDVPRSLETLLATAMDDLYDEIKSFLQNLKPHFVFFDFAHWVTEIALEIGGIKTLCYKLASPATSAISLIRSPEKSVFMASTAAEKVRPPPGYPSALLPLFFRRIFENSYSLRRN